jgi:cell division protein FtsB
MNTIYSAVGIINTIIVILAFAGGYIALKSGKHEKVGEIQDQVISALKAELETLQRRMDSLEKENTRLNQIMGLIKSALRRRGLTISIDGDLVTIDDGKGNSQYSHIQEGH